MDYLDLLTAMPTATGLLGLVLGLVVGSFLNVVIIRLPPRLAYQWQVDQTTSESSQVSAKPPPGIVLGRSHCPTCNHVIRWWENIPLLGYLILRGRCSSCQTRISIRYPAIEAFTAAVTLVIIWRLGVSSALVPALIFSWMLIALTFIDVDHFLLPDIITLPLLWLGLLVNLAGGFCDIHAGRYLHDHSRSAEQPPAAAIWPLPCRGWLYSDALWPTTGLWLFSPDWCGMNSRC